MLLAGGCSGSLHFLPEAIQRGYFEELVTTRWKKSCLAQVINKFSCIFLEKTNASASFFLQFLTWTLPKFWQLDSFHAGTMLVTHSCLPGEQRAKAKVWIALRFSQKLEEIGKCTKTHSTSVGGLAQTKSAIGAMPPKITAGIAPLSLEEPCREKRPWIILLIA